MNPIQELIVLDKGLCYMLWQKENLTNNIQVTKPGIVDLKRRITVSYNY